MGWSLGTFYPDYDWSQDEQIGVPLLASRFQDQLNKICLDGVTATWKRDGTNKPLQTMSMGGQKFDEVAKATGLAEFMSLGQYMTGENSYVRISDNLGTGQYTGDLAVDPSGLTTGMFVLARLDQSNPDGIQPTLDLNGNGQFPIYDESRNPITLGGTLLVGSFYMLVFYNDAWVTIGLKVDEFKGTISVGQFNDTLEPISAGPTINDMLLYPNSTQVSNSKYSVPITNDPNLYDTGVKPLVAGEWRVSLKVTSYWIDAADGYLGCGDAYRGPGETPLPDTAQLDYRYFVMADPNNGIGATSFSQYIYNVSQSDVTAGKYFPALAIWKPRLLAGVGTIYLDNFVHSAEFIGSD